MRPATGLPPAKAVATPYLSTADNRVWEMRFWTREEDAGSRLYRSPRVALHYLASHIRGRWDRLGGSRLWRDLIPTSPPTLDLHAVNIYFVAQPNSYPDRYRLDPHHLGRLPKSLRDLPVDELPAPDLNSEFAVGNVGGDWVCVCGNDAPNDGFVTCAADGRVFPPGAFGWDGLHYRCSRCNRIFMQPSGRVVNPPSAAG